MPSPTIDLAPFVRPGTGIWWSQACAEPTPLVHALLDQAADLGPVRAFCGISWDARLTTELPDEVRLVSYGALGALRALSRQGRLELVPCNISALPRLFATRRLPCDVGLVQVSPPDAHGRCTLGIGVDHAIDAIAHTPVVVAEINERMPPTIGAPSIPLERFAAVVRTDRSLLEAPVRVPDDVTRAIAQHVAALIEDGDTIQIGVGSIPSAVLDALGDHADIGVHSGMIADGMASLVDKGVITGARKEIDAGLMVTGAAIGGNILHRRIPDLPVRFTGVSYTHAPEVLAKLRSFVSVNAAIEVDLTGQVGAELRGDVYVGAIGGQADFCHAASTTGARSIIALRATSGEESAITPVLRSAAVTTPRTDVDFVVTEHGVAELTGTTMDERARRLVRIAAPEHRDGLERAVTLRHGGAPAGPRPG